MIRCSTLWNNSVSLLSFFKSFILNSHDPLLFIFECIVVCSEIMMNFQNFFILRIIFFYRDSIFKDLYCTVIYTIAYIFVFFLFLCSINDLFFLYLLYNICRQSNITTMQYNQHYDTLPCRHFVFFIFIYYPLNDGSLIYRTNNINVNV